MYLRPPVTFGARYSKFAAISAIYDLCPDSFDRVGGDVFAAEHGQSGQPAARDHPESGPRSLRGCHLLSTGIHTGVFCVLLPGPGRIFATDRTERRQNPVHAQKKKDRCANSRFHSGRHGQHRRLPAQYGQKKTHRLFSRI